MQVGRASLAFVFLETACGPCHDRTLRELPSPDSSAIASVLVRHCGAPTPPQTLVTLRRRWPWTTEFILEVKQEHAVELSWKTPRHLVVRCDSCAKPDVTGSKEVWQDIAIQFLWGGL